MKYFRVFKRKSDEYQMQSELEWQNVEQEHSGTCCNLKEADSQKRPTSDVLKKLSATLKSTSKVFWTVIQTLFFEELNQDTLWKKKLIEES